MNGRSLRLLWLIRSVCSRSTYAICKDDANSARSQMASVARLQQHVLTKPANDRTRVSALATHCKPPVDRSPRPTSESKKQIIEHKRTDCWKNVRKYNLIIGILSISSTESQPTSKSKTIDTAVKELNFYPTVNYILRRGFSLLCERYLGVWRYSLRTFSTFTITDLIFQLCVSGNLMGMKQLCSEGKHHPSMSPMAALPYYMSAST